MSHQGSVQPKRTIPVAVGPWSVAASAAVGAVATGPAAVAAAASAACRSPAAVAREATSSWRTGVGPRRSPYAWECWLRPRRPSLPQTTLGAAASVLPPSAGAGSTEGPGGWERYRCVKLGQCFTSSGLLKIYVRQTGRESSQLLSVARGNSATCWDETVVFFLVNFVSGLYILISETLNRRIRTDMK